MAEAVGLAASIIGIIGAAFTITKVVRETYKGFKDAPERLNVLMKDLECFLKSAESIRSLLDKGSLEDPIMAAIFSSSSISDPLARCNKEMQILMVSFEKMCVTSGFGGVWTRLELKMKEKDIQQGSERIKYHLLGLIAVESALSNQLALLNRDIGRETRAAIEQANQNIINNVMASQTTFAEVHKLQRMTKDVISTLDQRVVRFSSVTTSRLHDLESAQKSHLHELEKISEKTVVNTKVQQMVRWISPLHSAASLDRLESKVHPETGQWFLYSKFFVDFTSTTTSTLFWCTGKAGYGKSTIASVVIKHLQHTTTTYETDNTVLYAFIDKRDGRTLDENNITSSFIKQLCSALQTQGEELPKSLVDLYDSQGHQNFSGLTFTESNQYFPLIANLLKSHQIFLILDGLDECPRTSQLVLLKLCQSLVNNTTLPIIKILVFSRVDLTISQQLDEYTYLHLDATMNTPDINNYIERNVSDRFHGLSTKLKDEVMDNLKLRAGGMFQFVKCQVELVDSSFTTEQEVLSGLRSLPRDVNGIYEQAIVKVNQQETPRRDLAWKVFMWVVSAKRPMTLDELSEALCVKPGITNIAKDSKLLRPRQLIIGACCALITIDESDQVTVDHSTIQDFLSTEITSQRNPLNGYSIPEICLTYLLLDDFCRFGRRAVSAKFEYERRLQLYPLARYAVIFWADHVRGASETVHQDLLLKFASSSEAVASSLQLKEFLRNFDHRPRFGSCSQSYHVYETSTNAYEFGGYSTLHVFAAFGLQSINTAISITPSDLEARTLRQESPLYLAAAGYHWEILETVMQRMLELDCAKHIFQPNDLLYTPLHIAAFCGKLEIVSRLIDLISKEDTANWREYKRTSGGEQLGMLDSQTATGETPLIYAAKMGHLDVVRLLLKSGAIPQIVDKKGRSALFFSVRGNHVEVTKVLVDAGSRVNSVDKNGRTALHYAILSQNDSFGMVKTLVRCGADVKLHLPSPDHEAKTLLGLALMLDKVDIAMILSQDPEYSEALAEYEQDARLKAPQNSAEDVARKLWSTSDIKTDADSLFEWLLYAAEKRYHKLLEDLLDHQCKKRFIREQGERILCQAVRAGFKRIVHRLLDKGVNANARQLGSEGGLEGNPSALSISLEHGHAQITELLLTAGATFDEDFPKAHDENRPLDYALKKRDLDTIRVLLTHRIGTAEDSFQKDGPRSILHYGVLNHVVRKRKIDFVALLLEHSFSPNEKVSDEYETPLSIATGIGELEIVIMLLDKGAEVNTEGASCASPLALAARTGALEIAKLLLAKGAKVNHEGTNGTTPMKEAILKKHHDMTRWLIKNGVNINSAWKRSSGYGPKSPVECAIYVGDRVAIDLLISSGADLELVNPFNGFTPLMYAVSDNSHPMVDYLIAAGATVTLKDIISANRPEVLEHLLVVNHPAICLAEAITLAASEGGSTEGLEILLKQGLDPNALDESGCRPLHHACYFDDSNSIDCLVRFGADMTLKDKYDMSPLFFAIHEYRRNSTLKLVSLGADWNSEELGSKFWTPFIYSVFRRDKEVLKTMLDRSKNIRWKQDCLLVVENKDWPIAFDDGATITTSAAMCKYQDPWSPLWIAAILRSHNSLRGILALEDLRSAINIPDKHGMTILHWVSACAKGTVILKLLVDAGASVNVMDTWQRTPADIAFEFTASKFLHTALKNLRNQDQNKSKPQTSARCVENASILQDWRLEDDAQGRNQIMIYCTLCDQHIEGIFRHCNICAANVCDSCLVDERGKACAPTRKPLPDGKHKFDFAHLHHQMLSFCANQCNHK